MNKKKSSGNSKTVGFTGKVTSHGPGLYLSIPEATVESLGLEAGMLLSLNLRSMDGEEMDVVRKCQSMGKGLKIYLPKKVREGLGLVHKDLLDVFVSRKD